jgi:putrescine transport system permease protein
MPAPPPEPRPSGRASHEPLVNIGIPYLWLGLFFLLPFVIVLQISLAEPALAQPPYTALWQWVDAGLLRIEINLRNFMMVAEDDLYLSALLNSLQVAFICTLLCLLLGYPMAYAIATAPERWRIILLMLIVLPFWTSFLIRVYAWIGILKSNGLLNDFLIWLGLIDTPLAILHTQTAIYIGVVYSYLPFMILPLYANLTRLDLSLLEAAADLGCRPLRRLPAGHAAALDGRHRRRQHAGVHPGRGRVRDPGSARRTRESDGRQAALDRVLLQQGLAAGLGAGDPAAGAAGRALRDDAASAAAHGGQPPMRRRRWPLLTVLAFGYAFLYVPILLLIIYSFNESRLVTVWTGFSTKWYVELFRNQQLLDAAWLSVRIAAVNATLAVVLGTLAANALVRHRNFRGRTGFELLLTAPLVMPDVIIGLSLLLLFVAMQQTIGWPDGRGFTTITIAHVTFSMAYVAVVVRARLSQMDRSLEEAAMDLGARPLRVYLRSRSR